MNSNPDVPADTVPSAETDQPQGEGEAAAKPARKRRTTKAAAEATAGDAAAVESAAPATAQDEGEPAPKPRRRRAAPAAADAGEAVQVPSPVAAPATVVSTAVSEPVAQAPVATVESRTQPEPVAAASRSDDGDDADEDREGDEGAPEGETSASRNERRRRNRRDRRRGDGAPEVDVVAQAGAAAGEVFTQVLSGAFDVEVEAPAAEEAAEEPEVAKRVLAAEPDAPKLQKVLAQSGIGSRRDIEDMITDGRITVNGETAHTGQRISFGDRIQVDGKPVKVRIVPPPPRVIAYHKPVGEVVTHDDPQQRPTVFRRLPRLQQGKWQSVGRLDINTEGLLLFTNSGELANQLMHPRFGVEREYAVRVLGTLDEEKRQKLLAGVEIDGQAAAFRSIVDGGGEGANHWYRVVITEGRNREVRKLFDAVGMAVSRLIRIRYGCVVLPRGLKRGVWIDLGTDDVRAIRRLASGPRDQQPQQQRGGDEQRQGGRGNNKPQRNDRGPRNGPRPDGGPNARPPSQRERELEVVDRGAHLDDDEDDFDPARIPNPLEQTFDKRFVQNPRTGVGGRGFSRGGGGFGPGGSSPAHGQRKGGGAGGPKQPDPMQTSVGYIGGDAFHRKNRGGGGGGGGGRGGKRGGGGGGGGGFGFGGGNRGR
jgi:23S rRNA pseudouridine2605 synthase